jgi:hypothetical protein
MQQHFDLIPHPVQGGIIYQRPKDGYINATAMCQAASRQFGQVLSTPTFHRIVIGDCLLSLRL